MDHLHGLTPRCRVAAVATLCCTMARHGHGICIVNSNGSPSAE
jgi:hypothetical protein